MSGFLRTHLKAILLGVVALIIAGAFTVPSVDAIMNGRHKPVQLFRSISSDERHQITVTRRVALPANDVMDPTVIATFTLKDHVTGKDLETQEVKIVKESALQEPLFLWSNSSVVVKQFDTLQERALSFKRPE
ncbi:hypothetical protein OVA24_09865 [Luteolibacter sp. SL250]|uniref:hypothetical protein n=1 Tax=Luteolibacter sp. SL250 TaxID=2995170 RepID=UPI002271DD49|nr:hypothetical protein [Luteolibacter sp. SL250]WAC21691.1 hypothetical protein OVA24_09865 [Luteolibacter sp. SL250]